MPHSSNMPFVSPELLHQFQQIPVQQCPSSLMCGLI
jgi:hypothetical protein